jgi:predicted dehydrogenase
MKFGYFGTGYMAKIMAKTMVRIPEVELYAVSSRDTKRAELFAKENGFHNFFGSYEEMVNDSEIELVYIATPHALHYEQIKLCLEHNKSVICEKAFTGNAKQAAEVINLAHKKTFFW